VSDFTTTFSNKVVDEEVMIGPRDDNNAAAADDGVKAFALF
jgi:hypothetical protein